MKRIIRVTLLGFLFLQLNLLGQISGWDEPMTIPERKNINFPQWIRIGEKTAIIFVNNISNRSEICWQDMSSNHRLSGPVRTIHISSNLIFFPLSVSTHEDRILIILNDERTRLHTLTSLDRGNTWSARRIFPDKEFFFVPTVVFDAAGTAHLFTHMEFSGRFTLYYSQSIDAGANWAPLRSVLKGIENRDAKNRGDFFPTIISHNNSLYLALQNRSGGGEDVINDEIYLLESHDRGTTWGLPKRLTVNKLDDIRPKLLFIPAPSDSTNQNGTLFLFWEKNVSNTWSIYTRKGNILFDKSVAWEDERQIIRTKNNTHWPTPIPDNGSIALFWHEYKGKNDHILYRSINITSGELKGNEIQLSDNQRNNRKPTAIKIGKDILVAWQSEEKRRSSSYLMIRVPDRFILAPDLFSRTHENGIPSREKSVHFGVKTMPDISGIKGFAAILDQNPNSEPDILNFEATNYSATFNLMTDGTYFFHIKVVDNAENWSPTTHYKVILDTRGPEIVSIDSSDFSDGVGSFKTSGDFFINARDDSGIQGYSYVLGTNPENPPARINSTTNLLNIANLKVGKHILIVRAVDKAGNWGYPLRYSIVVKGDEVPPTKPDIYSPTLSGYSITSNNTIEFSWNSSDQFGIRGYSWILTKISNEEPPQQINRKTNNLTLDKIRNGDWYFKIRAVDPSGNWSPISIFPFKVERDDKGPTLLSLKLEESLENLNTRTNGDSLPQLTFVWSGSDENGIERYEYSFSKKGKSTLTNFQAIRTNGIRFTNVPRDEYLFLLRAIDTKNNESEILSLSLPLLLKKKDVEKSGDYTYTVKFKDTLSSIIRRIILVTPQNNKNYWQDIAWYNKIDDVDMIRIDQKIRFPAVEIGENKDKEYLAAFYLGDPGRADDIIFIDAKKDRIILRDKYFLRHGKLKNK